MRQVSIKETGVNKGDRCQQRRQVSTKETCVNKGSGNVGLNEAH